MADNAPELFDAFTQPDASFDPSQLEALLDDLDSAASADGDLQLAAGHKGALLAAADFGGRLRRFAPALAPLLDVSEDRAAELLAGLDNRLSWEGDLLPNVTSVWVDGGPATKGCIRGFVRLEAGHPFPHHSHLGDETCLVLQGYMVCEDGTVLGPGDVARSTPEVEHGFRAQGGCADLLYFSVVREGIRIGDIPIVHRDD